MIWLGLLLLVSCNDGDGRSLTGPGAALYGKQGSQGADPTLVGEINADIECLYAGDADERSAKLDDFKKNISLYGRTSAQAEAVRSHVNNFVRDIERYVSTRGPQATCGGKGATVLSQELFNRLYLFSEQFDKVVTPAYGTDAMVIVCRPGVRCQGQSEGAAVDVPSGAFDIPVLITMMRDGSPAFDYTPFEAAGAPVPPPYHFDVAPAISANGDGWGRFICVSAVDADNGTLQLFRRDQAGAAQGIGNDADEITCTLQGQRTVGGYDILASPHVVVRLAGTAEVSTFCPGGPVGTYDDLQAAVDNTAPGGTVDVCDGEYNADSVIIDKPLTVRSQNAGQATLGDEGGNVCCQGGLHPVFIIRGVASGLVRFASINFEVSGGAILAGNWIFNSPAESWDQIEIDSVSFVGRDTLMSYPVRTVASSVAGAKLQVTNSRFRDAQIGVFVLSGEVNVRSSIFTQMNRGVVYSFPGINPAVAATGTTENNQFDWCGWGGCIRVLGRGGVTVRGNTVDVSTGIVGRGFAGAIHVQLQAAAPPLPVIVEDNVVTGVRVTANPPDSTGWTIRNGLMLVGSSQGAHTITARRNTITNAYTGIVFSVPVGVTADAYDNTISDGAYALRHRGQGIGKFRRNDVLNTIGSVLWDFPAGPRDYTCNWWGSASGPSNPPPQLSTTAYTPWAMEQIAGRPEVSCP